MIPSYRPLARRYRPRAFTGPQGVVGQGAVVRTLQNAIVQGTLAQAYLLTGPRGTGKTTLARIVAASLNCPARTPDGEPCGLCPSCAAIIAGREANDVVEIDAATNRGADDARELRQRAQYAPTTPTGTKVYILDEAHMLTREAWNALLKILEEPPPRVCFIFCTTEPQKIEQTAEPILSRCQRLDLRRIAFRDLVTALQQIATQEGLAVPDDVVALLARRADGGLRDALSSLDQLVAFAGPAGLTAAAAREAFGWQSEAVLLQTLDLLAAGDRARSFKLVRYLEAQAVDLVRFAEEVQDACAAMVLAMHGGESEGWSAQGLAGLMQRAGRDRQGSAWVAQRAPLARAAFWLGAMRVAQEDLALLRAAPRPALVLLTLLDRAMPASPASPLPGAEGPPAVPSAPVP